MTNEAKEKNMPYLPKKAEEFGYLDLKPISGNYYYEESFQEKLFRKCKENPFVPLGLGITTGALIVGVWQMKTGNRAMSQKMMRLRVVAQGSTIVALLFGVAFNAYKVRKTKAERNFES